jgi:hypothetical protein
MFGVGAVASRAAAPKSYKTCTSLNKVYPHGVGRKGARDKTASGPRVTNFRVNNTVYASTTTARHRATPANGTSTGTTTASLARSSDGARSESRNA